MILTWFKSKIQNIVYNELLINNHCVLLVFIFFKSFFLVFIENVPPFHTKPHPVVTYSTYL